MAKRNVALTVRVETRNRAADDKPVDIRALVLGKAWGAAKESKNVVRDLLSQEGQTLLTELRYEPPLRTDNPYGLWWDGVKIEAINKMRSWEGTQKHYGWQGGKGANAHPVDRSHRYRDGWQIELVDNVELGLSERGLAGIRVVNDALDEDGDQYVSNVGGEVFVDDNPYSSLGYDGEATQAPYHKDQGWPTVANVLTIHFDIISSSWYDRMKAIIERDDRKVTTQPPEWNQVDGAEF